MNGIVILFVVTISINLIASLVGITTTLKLYFDLKRAIPLILVMTVILLSWFFSNLFLLLGSIFNRSDSTELFSISQVFLVLTFSIFIYFSALFSGDFSTSKIVAIIAYPVATYTLWIAELYTSSNLMMKTIGYQNLTIGYWQDISYFISASGVLITGYWVIKGLVENLEFAHTHKQIKSLKYMKYGSYLAFVIGPISGFPGYLYLRFEENTGLGILIFYIIGYSVISIGVFLLAFTYNNTKEISFLVPQKIEKLLVIHTSGISLFSYDFGLNQNSNWNDQLVSGLVHAATKVMGASLGISTEITEIKFIDRTIMINVREQVAFVLVTKKRSQFLEDALNRFANQFLLNYQGLEHSNQVHKLDSHSNIVPLVSFAFGIPSQ